MINRFYPGSLKGRIRIPSSKSLTHRALIAASLANGLTQIHHPLYCDDTMTTIACLQSLGIDIQTSQNDIILNSPGFYTICGPLDVKESATTFRLMVGAISMFSQEFTIQAHPRLIERIRTNDLDDLDGLTFTFMTDAIHIVGTLNQKQYYPALNITTQWASGLCMLLPFKFFRIHDHILTGDYVRLTVSMMKQFGIELIQQDGWLTSKGQYLPQKVTIESDYSSAAFFIGMAILNNHVRIEDLSRDSLQPDVRIISYFEQMGAQFSITPQYLKCTGVHFKDCTIDLTQNPDLAPILAAVASVSSKHIVLTGLEKLEYKESNRLLAIRDSLNLLGANVIIHDMSLVIEGKRTLYGDATVEGYRDHRIIMSLVAINSRIVHPFEIIGCEYVNKSFPDFFNYFQRVGGIYESSVSTSNG